MRSVAAFLAAIGSASAQLVRAFPNIHTQKQCTSTQFHKQFLSKLQRCYPILRTLLYHYFRSYDSYTTPINALFGYLS